MKKKVELPLVDPIYRTYHYEGCGAAIIANNPSIRNWYLNEIMNLVCTRKFLTGFTTPQLTLYKSSSDANPYLEKEEYSMNHAKGYINHIIRELLDDGYYVFFAGPDDYYIEGKSWYKERHFYHTGLICGYDQEKKTYTMYAYDSNWRFQKFVTSQKSFDIARKAMLKNRVSGRICALRPLTEVVEFNPQRALLKMKEYVESTFDKYPITETGYVFGIAAMDYLAIYLDKLYNSEIPYDRMDRRVMRLIWEHKRAMLERIQKIEEELHLDNETSTAYADIVKEADGMRLLYASHKARQRNSLLPIIRGKLLAIKDEEYKLLTAFIQKAGGELAE